MIRVKAFIKLFLLSVILAAFLLPGTVFIHEATHYLLYTYEGIQVTSFHVLDEDSFQQGRYGYITTNHESKYGHVFQESVAYVASYLFFSCALLFCLVIPCKFFTISQLKKMGLHDSFFSKKSNTPKKNTQE